MWNEKRKRMSENLKEKAEKIGISPSLLKSIIKNRQAQSIEEIDNISSLYLLLNEKISDPTFLFSLTEKLHFLFQYGSFCWNQDGISGSVEIHPNLNYSFRLLVQKNKISSYVTLGKKTIEESYIKDKNCSYAFSITTIRDKKEKMLYGFINKDYDSYQDHIKKEFHVFDKEHLEIVCYEETRTDDYAVDRNTDKKIINTYDKNLNYLHQQYIFRVHEGVACKKEVKRVENRKEEVFYYIEKDNKFIETSRYNFEASIKQIRKEKAENKIIEKILPNK